MNFIPDLIDYHSKIPLDQIPPYGYTYQKIGGKIYYDKDGKITSFVYIDSKSDIAMSFLPDLGRTSGISPMFCCDKLSYVFGLSFNKNNKSIISKEDKVNDDDDNAKLIKTLKIRNDAFIDYHNKNLKIEDPRTIGFLKMCQSNHDELRRLYYESIKLVGDSIIAFYYDKDIDPLHIVLKDIWVDEIYPTLNQSDEMVSIFDGKKGKIQRKHPKIKYLGESLTLSSYNDESYSHYGINHGHLTVRDAYRYTSALNYLIGVKKNFIRLNDTLSVVFWGNNEVENVFWGLLTSDGEAEVENAKKQIQRIKNLSASGIDLSKEKLNLMGLTFNSTRAVVPFYYKVSFSKFFKLAENYIEDMYSILNQDFNLNSIINSLLSISKDGYHLYKINEVKKSIVTSLMVGKVDSSVDEYLVSLLINFPILLEDCYNGEAILAILHANKKMRSNDTDMKNENENEYNMGRIVSTVMAMQKATCSHNKSLFERYGSSMFNNPKSVLGELLCRSHIYGADLDDWLRIFYEKKIQEIYDSGFQSEDLKTMDRNGVIAFHQGFYNQNSLIRKK